MTEDGDGCSVEFMMRGGGGNGDYPSGGFPPIFVCENKDEQSVQSDDKSRREYKTHKSAISIKSLLEKRRTKT